MRKILLTLAATALPPSAAMAQGNTLEYTSNGLNSPSGQASLPRTTNLTLNTALERAYAANPELAAARNALLAQDGTIRQAETRPNPELQALVEDTRSATRTSTLQLNQRIELGGKRSARIDAAERGKNLAEADLAMVRATLQTEVTSAFYDTLVAQERVRLTEQCPFPSTFFRLYDRTPGMLLFGDHLRAIERSLVSPLIQTLCDWSHRKHRYVWVSPHSAEL